MELRLPNPTQLPAIYEADLRPSFPPAELKPLRAMEQMWADGCYRPWCLFDGEQIVGECFLWLGHEGFALLDYLCVSPRRRNGGLGAQIIEKMLEKEPDTVILAESEAPVHAPDPQMAHRRLGFYDRCGARLADYDTAAFGIHYKTLYWAEEAIDDAVLMAEHRFIYQNRFSPEKYARHIRIPYDPAQPLSAQTAWHE